MNKKEQIGLVLGTNRKNAMTTEMVYYYQNLLQERGYETVVLDLGKLPKDFAFSALYDAQGTNTAFNEYQSQIDALQKIIFIVPEYNGSFPGVTKVFLDGLRYPDTMDDKKVALVGLASGVQGNAVGISHLSDVLSYMGANVLGLKVKLGSIYQHFDGKEISHTKYIEFINTQLDKFLAF